MKNKKLQLNKETIAQLNHNNMINIIGGFAPSVCCSLDHCLKTTVPAQRESVEICNTVGPRLASRAAGYC